MKAIQINDRKPALIDIAEPSGDGVKIRVVSSSICGSDLHMISRGWAENRILGHEFAGYTPDGTAVAIEPIHSCGTCPACNDGYRNHCTEGAELLGVTLNGGMAEYVMAAKENLVVLPTGLDIHAAALVEPLAVALHGLNRSSVTNKDKVLVIGAGPIGLMTAAALQARGVKTDIIARHEHQQMAAHRLGASPVISDRYDVIFDAVGTPDALTRATQLAMPMGRVIILGTFWDPVTLGLEFTNKELQLIASSTYQCKHEGREFVEAGKILASNSDIIRALITHRFPLDGVVDAFNTAADRSAGAIKVVFDI